MTERQQVRLGEFSTKMMWSWPAVSKLLDRKLWSLEQLEKFVQHRAAMCQDELRLGEKLAKQTPQVLYANCGLFEEGTMCEAWAQLLRTEEERCRLQSQLGSDLEEVRARLSAAADSLRQSCKKISSEGNSLAKQHADAVGQLAKARGKYNKACGDLDSLQDASADERKISRTRDEAHEAEQAYLGAVSSANAVLESYRRAMPRCLAECEFAMRSRVQAVKEALAAYSAALKRATAAEYPLSAAIERATANLSSNSDLVEYARKEENASATPPSAYAFEKHESRHPSAAVSAVRQQASGAGGDLFGQPLSVQLEKDPSPDVPGVPRVLSFLLETTLALGGAATKGIFRLAGDSKQVAKFREEAAAGKEFLQFSDPHDSASCAKLWLRSLPEPLVPVSLYEKAVADHCKPMEVFASVQQPSRDVLGYVLCFLKHMSQPEVSSDTHMTDANLAAMFSPCLMKCPYDDLSATLIAVEREKSFLIALINGVDPTKFPPVRLPKNPAPPPVDLSGTRSKAQPKHTQAPDLDFIPPPPPLEVQPLGETTPTFQQGTPVMPSPPDHTDASQKVSKQGRALPPGPLPHPPPQRPLLPSPR